MWHPLQRPVTSGSATIDRNFALQPASGTISGIVTDTASGLPIAAALFPPDTVGATVLPVLVYHMSQLLVCAMIAQHSARRNQEQALVA